MSTLPCRFRLCFLALTAAVACVAQSSQPITKSSFGKTPDGKELSLYTLQSPSGMKVTITNYGGVVTTIQVPDRNGKMGDVVLGYDNSAGYLSKESNGYFGALIGRYGNRIARGKFSIEGHEYQIPVNDGPNSLHGGTTGFNARVWDAKDVSHGTTPILELHYKSPDGEMGFPGTLDTTVHYTLDNNALRIDYAATTDNTTVLNLTNHTYFNLAGAGTKSVLDHKVMLAADRFTPVDETLIPTGALEPVAGTPLDFRKPMTIGARIDTPDEQIKRGKGYDHNYVLNAAGDIRKMAARVEEPTSGRILEVFTDQPGLQFYSGNFLTGKNKGIGGLYERRSAFCMETQHFPDSPNHPTFPTTQLKPGQKFHSTTIYRFSAK